MPPDERIARALEIAEAYGHTDGAHHKMWVIDQMVRALTDCPPDAESDAYRMWIAAYNADEDGPNTDAWDTGIAP